MLRRLRPVPLLLAIFALTVTARADEPSTDERLAALERELAALRAEVAAQGQSHASVASPFPGVTLSGFAQIDLAFRQSAENQLDPSGEPLNEDRFTLRRARLRATGEFGIVGSALELDFNTARAPQARIVNAELTLGLPPDKPGAPRLIAASIGLFKIPFGLEVLQSDRDRLFLERSTVIRALFPGEYDLGGRVAGSWWFLRYAVAVQNGNPLGDKQFPGRDPNNAKDVAGRVGVEVELGDVRLSVGGSAEAGRGFHAGTAATKDSIVWRDLNGDGVIGTNEIQIVRGRAALPSIDFDRFAVGADASLAVDVFGIGPLTLYGEIISAKNLDRGVQPADPVASSRDLRELGWYVAAIQKLGPFEVGVRYDRYDPDADRSGIIAGAVVPIDSSYSTWSVAAAYVLTNARILVEADINRNHLGLDASGVPGNRDDDAITVRGEMRF